MTITSRVDALTTLKEGQRELEELLGRLSDDQLVAPATIGDGNWSAKDLMGHVAFWEELAIEALASWRSGSRPPVEDVFDAGSDGVDQANARDQAQTAEQPLEEVRRRAAASHAQIRDAIDRMSEEEWSSKAPYPTDRRRRLGELLGSIMGAPQRPFGHAFAHLPDLQTYVSSLG